MFGRISDPDSDADDDGGFERLQSSRGGGYGNQDNSGKGRRAAGPPFVFISVFKWEGRKGWDALLEAYLSEFTCDVSGM